jgi:hypothetical protein
MALQTSGQISMSNIANEKGETLSNVSLSTLSEVNINEDPCNPANSTASAPYGISEFYGYDHNCVTGPSTFEISMSGGYRSPDEACGDKGRSAKRLLVFSDCEPFAIGPGCLIFEDPEGESLWAREEWYYHELTATSYFISRGEIVDKLPCFK